VTVNRVVQRFGHRNPGRRAGLGVLQLFNRLIHLAVFGNALA